MDLEHKAIERMQLASQMSLTYYQKPLIITDSGGKDSAVLVDLALKAKIPLEVMHSHTTADAPETVRYIRDKFRRLELQGIKCQIKPPRYKGQPVSMWTLIPIKKVPPTRMARYCCSILKESNGKDRMIATGVRWDESVQRSNRGIYETLAADRSKKITLSNDNDDTRQLFEHCQLKATRVCNPIIDWTHGDIWTYIHSERVEYNCLYDCGFGRVGCIGCPMASRRWRYRWFRRYPKYRDAYIRAFDRMIEAIRQSGRQCKWQSGYDVYQWWMEEDPEQITMEEYLEEQDNELDTGAI